MKVLLTVLAVIAWMAGAEASAQFSPDRSLEVHNVWARIAPNEADTISVFFEIISHGDRADALRSASSPAAEKVTLRRGKWKVLSFTNEPVPEIAVRAHRRTDFRPGRYEVTLSQITRPVEVGTVLPVTLIFKEAGSLDIQVTVGNQLLGNRTRK